MILLCDSVPGDLRRRQIRDPSPDGSQESMAIPFRLAGARPHGRNAGRCILSTVRALRLPQGCTGNSPSRVFSPEEIPTRRDVTLLSKTETDHQQRSDQPPGRAREAALPDTVRIQDIPAICRNNGIFGTVNIERLICFCRLI